MPGARRTETRSPTVTTSTWTVGRRRFKAGGPGNEWKTAITGPITGGGDGRGGRHLGRTAAGGPRCRPSRIRYSGCRTAMIMTAASQPWLPHVSQRRLRCGPLGNYSVHSGCVGSVRPEDGILWRASANRGREHLWQRCLAAYPGASWSRFALCGNRFVVDRAPWWGLVSNRV